MGASNFRYACRCSVAAGLIVLTACTTPDKVALEEYAPTSPEADIEAVSLSASDNDTFDPERVGTEFPDPTEQVAVWYRWSDADSGKKVGIRWSKDGEVVLEQGDTLAEVSGASAYVLKMAAGSKLPLGNYQVELSEDGVAVTKIPFKVGDAGQSEVAAVPERSEAQAAAEPAVPEKQSVGAPPEEEMKEPASEGQSMAAASAMPASAGFPAAQPTKWPGVTVQVTELARKGRNLSAKLRFTNNGETRVRPGFYYAGTYAIDDNNQKYEVIKDDKGAYLGSLGTGYNNWWGDDLDPGASQLIWMRFPAPPAGIDVVTIQLDGMEPIEGVQIQN